ncbi:MAG: bifunctional folylpolyglutamate synthase/dihydrofolate synthase [Ruminococcus flavefaciens]|nr:bifunctional folylpolyglutamate synthase/dihydrofolate synthase [Ruminococcus flavefaciens]
MNYNEYIDYLKKSSGRGICLGLERISALMEKLGNPQNKTKIIHVSGTNGKGSFSAMLTSVLKSAGYKVGGFSSPALTGITDSFRIDCKEITEKDFTEIMDIVYPVCESMNDKPTEFEILTAVAFELFYRKKCGIAVVECGMGGDTDSTNIIDSPVLSVITNVRKDHTAFLGNTIEEIACHKAGIIKHGRPIFFGGDKVPEIITKTATEKSAELFTAIPHDIKAEYSLSRTDFTYNGLKINLSLLGTYQLDNAFNVLQCIEILRNQGFTIPDKAITDGLNNAKWHGRFEVLRQNPPVIFDGSHNPDGISRTAESIETYFKSRVVLLIGVMADKEYNLYADMLGKYTDCVFTVKPDNPRSLDCQTLAGTFSAKGIPACAFHKLERGVESAYSYAKEKNLPLIALGSLYMYKEFVNALDKI